MATSHTRFDPVGAWVIALVALATLAGAWIVGPRDIGASVTVPGVGAVPLLVVGYGLVVVLSMAGVVRLLGRFDAHECRRLVYSTLPFMGFAGALLALGDAKSVVGAGGIPTPTNALVAGPVLPMVAMLVPLAVLAGGVGLAGRGAVARYDWPLIVAGFLAFGLALGQLFVVASAADSLGFAPMVLLVALVGTTVLSVVVWAAVARIGPGILSGTDAAGLFVLWGYTLDGLTAVLANDWAGALGAQAADGPTNLLTSLVVDTTAGTLPPAVTAAIGTAWPLLVLKMIVALGVVYFFDEELVEGTPRMATVMLIAVAAVAVVPGTRALLGLAFGI